MSANQTGIIQRPCNYSSSSSPSTFSSSHRQKELDGRVCQNSRPHPCSCKPHTLLGSLFSLLLKLLHKPMDQVSSHRTIMDMFYHLALVACTKWYCNLYLLGKRPVSFGAFFHNSHWHKYNQVDTSLPNIYPCRHNLHSVHFFDNPLSSCNKLFFQECIHHVRRYFHLNILLSCTY